MNEFFKAAGKSRRAPVPDAAMASSVDIRPSTRSKFPVVTAGGVNEPGSLKICCGGVTAVRRTQRRGSTVMASRETMTTQGIVFRTAFRSRTRRGKESATVVSPQQPELNDRRDDGDD